MSSGGYAPVSITNNSTNWPDATGGQKTNGTAFTFAASSGAWSSPADYWWLTDAAAGLSAPTTPSVTPTGTTGSTAWYYVITALNSEGETTGSGVGVTTVGNAVLSGSNYNALAWTAVSGAVSYNVYRSATNVAGSFHLIANPGSNAYNDMGASAGTQTPPMSNTTMTLLDGGPLSTPIIVPDTGFVVAFEADSIVIAA